MTPHDADELADLRVLREHLASNLDLPASTDVKTLAVKAGTAIRFYAAEQALSEHQHQRAVELCRGS
jgi:hypothetical protein